MGGKKVGKSKTQSEVQNLVYSQKAIMNLKSAGEITIRFPSVGLAGNEIEIGLHCDAGNILTKWGIKSQIGICGFLRENAIMEIKIRFTWSLFL